MKFGCITKLIFIIIFVIGVGYYLIDKYLLRDLSNGIKEKLITEFVESNFNSVYKDSISVFLKKSIDKNKIDFNFIKEIGYRIKDFSELNDSNKFLQIKEILEKDGTQN